MTAIASRAHFPDLVLLRFGLYFQQMVKESRLVFYLLRVAPESLAEKALDVGLKLLPSLIRCPLIHCNYLLIFSLRSTRSDADPDHTAPPDQNYFSGK
jgi:hypothetical protein